MDEPIAALVQAELERHARLRLGARLDEVRPGPDGTLTAVIGGADTPADLVVIATGVRPASDLLIQAGAEHLADRLDPGRRGDAHVAA